MKTRTKPLTIPDSRIYVELEVPGRGPHHFRLPRIARAVELLELIPRDEVADTVNVLEAGSRLEQMKHYASIEERAALLVGELWWHPTLELESPKGDGAALAEEFHEAGYAPAEIYSLCLSLYMPLSGLLFPLEEAREGGGFFVPTSAGDATPQ